MIAIRDADDCGSLHITCRFQSDDFGVLVGALDGLVFTTGLRDGVLVPFGGVGGFATGIFAGVARVACVVRAALVALPLIVLRVVAPVRFAGTLTEVVLAATFMEAGLVSAFVEALVEAGFALAALAGAGLVVAAFGAAAFATGFAAVFGATFADVEVGLVVGFAAGLAAVFAGVATEVFVGPFAAGSGAAGFAVLPAARMAMAWVRDLASLVTRRLLGSRL